MKLCGYCVENILKSDESWDYHRTYTDLKAGSEWTVERGGKPERCLFCSTLRQDIETLAPELKESNEPIYRWNIRSLARIRESLETIVVTFRQNPITRNDGDVLIEEAKLPERTFYFFPEDTIAPLPSIENLGTSTDPRQNGGRQIKSWIDTCDATHKGCMKRQNAEAASTKFVPTRLLDIRGPPESDFKVIETKITPARSPYATLSHCWGKKRFVCLLPENKEKFMTEGVPWNELTKNFKEAIEVARFLGIEYIWIDSLCIVQGPGGDFAHEGTLMHLVYRNSYCNIAIVDSFDSTGGAFRERDPGDVAAVRYKPQEESSMFGLRKWGVIAGDLWERELLQTELYVRGWVFQERMLAPRILHFANRQIFWDCPSLSACEALPSGLPSPMDSTARPDRRWRGRLQEQEEGGRPVAGANDDSIDEFWRTAVRKYTKCALTKGSDKLVAMWGIAKLVRDAKGVEYAAGLWEQNLEDQLTWRVKECTLRERPSDSKEWNLERDIPSWSWASMDGLIEVPDNLTDVSHYTVKDHSGLPLAFELVDGKGLGPAPEEVALNEEVKKTNANDAPPELKEQSLKIQCHVGQARLDQVHMQQRYLLRVDGLDAVDIDAYPDLILDFDKEEDRYPFFAVLSAKQYVRPIENTDEQEEEDTTENDGQMTDDDKSTVYAQEIVFWGLGILMKKAKKEHYFHRTGAFNFRNLSREQFAKLQVTVGSDQSQADIFDPVLGRKIWLQ
ncbi:HET-domain-containing protein [Byssothecium circinans]|uniref:HET-domain-containing protein n=1 Tax=Byssothecium circinans TaxID=147558 RepID=A0A6A5U4J7_9PLEO|nr:HET-domain-containing protein [Byssothecium circinans]